MHQICVAESNAETSTDPRKHILACFKRETVPTHCKCCCTANILANESSPLRIHIEPIPYNSPNRPLVESKEQKNLTPISPHSACSSSPHHPVTSTCGLAFLLSFFLLAEARMKPSRSLPTTASDFPFDFPAHYELARHLITSSPSHEVFLFSFPFFFPAKARMKPSRSLPTTAADFPFHFPEHYGTLAHSVGEGCCR